MSQVIPGGRPRASSDGDILDVGDCNDIDLDLVDSRSSGRGDSTQYLGPGRRKDNKVKVKPQKLPTKTKQPTRLKALLPEINDDVFDSDGGVSSQSTDSVSKTQKRSRRLSFKSVKKAVSRAFVKDHNIVNSTSTNDQVSAAPNDNSVINYSGKIWTPELRRIGKGYSGVNGSGGHQHKLTMSSARPLVMDPEIEMTIPKWKNVPGTNGIYNHGSSCFINTILQCLSNTDSFTEYFVQDFFKNDLKQNKNNKKSVFRSSHGEVTEQLAYLLKSLWCGNYHSDISKEFKAVVGKYNDQYRGDDQHDAQEFLLWLLDRLHEDLCIPPKKKSKPQKGVNSKSEDEVSLDALTANGDSFVLKLFQALHNSTLTCPSCDDRSSTFDPYLCVSLPLPQSCPRIMFVIIVTLQAFPKEVKYAFTLNQFDHVRELRESITAETGIPENQFILCQLKEDGFGATYSDEQPLSDVAENETIYAVETFSEEDGIEAEDPEFDSPQAQVFVLHVETTEGSSRRARFWEPSLLKVNRDITWRELQKSILSSMEDAIYPDIFSQKLSPLFTLTVWDGSSSSSVLPSDVEMPLYTQAAERALNTLSEDFGPSHIKLIALWNTQTKNKVIHDDKEHIKINQSVRNVNTNPPTHVSLDECFRLYTQEEKLIGDDAWLCPHCKQQQQGTIKSLGLWSLPDVLVLHLKRFKQTSHRRSKLDTLVEFPVDNLNMSPHLAKNKANFKPDDYTYDLIGVSNHFGNMMGGHYTAFCRSPIDGKWREFNDMKVSTMEGRIATKEAYILFYQRRSLSKDINQKMFTGDHWVFTLPLSSTNKIEETNGSGSTAETSTLRTRRTRSRSSSPMSHRHANGTSRPTSPLHSPLSSRPSRPLQRQHSSPRQVARRGKSANAATSSSKVTSQLHDDSELAGVKNGILKRDGESVSNAVAKKIEVTVINHTKETDTGYSQSKDSKSSFSSIAASKSNVSNSHVNSSRPLQELKPIVSQENKLQSDAKYPPSSHLSSTVDKENRSANNSSHFDFPSESAGALRVNLENIDGPVASQSTSSSHVLNAETARKKLADRKKDHSNMKQNGSLSSHNTKLSYRTTPHHKYQSQRNYEQSKSNLIAMDSDTPKLMSTSPDAIKYQDRDFSIFSSETSNRDLNLRLRRDSFDCSTLEEEAENVLYPDETRMVESSLRARITDERLKKLASKHFGEPRLSEELDRSLDYVPNRHSGIEPYRKYATIARSKEILSSPGFSKDSSIPRSRTDQNIYHSNFTPSLIAPPSPTPPHSIREEKRLGTHLLDHRLPSRDFSSFSPYDRHQAYRYEDQGSLASSRLSSKYASGRFSRPRGLWGVTVKPTKIQGNVSNPYLRESSV